MKRWILLFNLYNINYYVSIKDRPIPWFPPIPFCLFPLSLLCMQYTYYLSNFSLFLRKSFTQMTVLLYKNDENVSVTPPPSEKPVVSSLSCTADSFAFEVQMAPTRRRFELTRRRNSLSVLFFVLSSAQRDSRHRGGTAYSTCVARLSYAVRWSHDRPWPVFRAAASSKGFDGALI